MHLGTINRKLGQNSQFSPADLCYCFANFSRQTRLFSPCNNTWPSLSAGEEQIASHI